MLHVEDNTISTTNKRFALEGWDAALADRPRPGAERTLDGRGEAQLIALACSKAPTGQARGSLRQLTERLIQLQVVEDISYETVRRTLKKRSQTLAEETGVHSASQPGVCQPDGRPSRPL